MSTDRLTHLNVDVYVHENESFMADGTTLSLDLTTFLNRLNPAVSIEQGGILSKASYHITPAEAEKMIEALQKALAELEVSEVA